MRMLRLGVPPQPKKPMPMPQMKYPSPVLEHGIGTGLRVMFVAVFADGSTNNAQSRGLQRAGCKVIEYDYRKKAEELGANRDADLVKTCEQRRPDLVLFSKCSTIHCNVIDECNKITKTALWYMDPMNNFNTELVAKIERCNYTFCALTVPYEESKKYSPSVHFLHEGFDGDSNFPVNVPYKHDVSFIGMLKGERRAWYDKHHFHVYSNVYDKNHSTAVCESKINLNFVHEGEGTSDRTYKVLASKGFLMTQTWKGMEADFVDGRDFVVFNEQNYEDKVKYYLNHEEERKQIAEQGYQTVQKFSRDAWAINLLKCL